MAKFCTKCGSKLVDGQICPCRQESAAPVPEVPVQPAAETKAAQPQPDINPQAQPKMNPQPQPEINQQAQQGMNQQYQQAYMGQRGSSIDVKNLFSQFKPMLKTPVIRIRQLSQRKNSLMGFEMIGLRAIVSIIMVLIVAASIAGKINASIGGAMSSLNLEDILSGSGNSIGVTVPYFKLTVTVLALTAGLDLVEALFLKLFTVPKAPAYNYSFMALNVGSRALPGAAAAVIDGLLILLAFVAGSSVFITIAFVVIAAIHITITYIQFAAYNAVVKNTEDVKVYRFALAKICTFIVRLIVIYLIVKSLVEQFATYLTSFAGSMF